MRQRRKCLYRNCGHNQGDNKFKCKFHKFPKDSLLCLRWLHLSGIYDKTPKKMVLSWCICSCHFPGGKSQANCFPEEFIEEFIFLSPSCKARRAGPVNELTPSTKAAVEALMSLPTAMETEVTETEAKSPLQPRRKTPTYSPSRRLWITRNNEVRQKMRKSFHELNDISELRNVCDMDDVSDLGVKPFPEVLIPAIESKVNTSLVKEERPDTPLTDTIFCDPPKNTMIPRKLFGDLWSASDETNIVSSTPSIHGFDSGLQKRDVCSIGTQCSRSSLSYEKCKLFSERQFQFYTGLTQECFELLYEFLGGDEVCCALKYSYDVKSPKRQQFIGDLFPKDKLFLTLLRLRRGFTLKDLELMFNVSQGHTSKIFYTWMRLMSIQFKKLEKVMFVPAAVQGQKPKCFDKYENLRVIIDAVEIKIQKPKNFQQNSNSHSQYKGCNTAKFLVGISCYGGLSFISEGYEGSITDRKLLIKCGFLDHLEARDGVMADRGFDIADIADERDFDLYIPAFLNGRTYFSGRELIHSRGIAESRIHVERFISRMKEFRLIRFGIPNSLLPIASDMVKVCAFLVNFQCPFIKLEGDDS